MDDVQAVVEEFVDESRANLDQVERDLVLLDPGSPYQEKLSCILRAIHTIKGASGFLGFQKLQDLTHAGENVLASLRDGQMELRSDIATHLLALTDAVRDILANIESLGDEGETDCTDLLQQLANLHSSPEGPRLANPASARRKSGEALPFSRIARSQKPPDTQINDSVTNASVQPIGSLFENFRPLVQALASQCGKQVRVEVQGQETRLEKSIIEGIRAPLIHLLRNAVDHGIETPEERAKCGKPVEGLVMLRAAHCGQHVQIEAGDDGRGLDLPRIRRQAVQRGLLSDERAQHLTDDEAAMLIFAPGLSTAASVTHLSGRGVGMDVVKHGIEQLGGSVAVETGMGKGLTIHLILPVQAPGPQKSS